MQLEVIFNFNDLKESIIFRYRRWKRYRLSFNTTDLCDNCDSHNFYTFTCLMENMTKLER